MNETELATCLNIGITTVSTILQSYSTFKKSNVEKYFELLLKEDKDLSRIGSNELLQKHVYKIIDYAANEVYEEKIEKWKNLTVKLGLGQLDYDFAENYSKILDDLTEFDLTILHQIYDKIHGVETITDSESLSDLLSKKGISKQSFGYSLKKLESNFLIDIDEESLTNIGLRRRRLDTNEFGKEFLEVISNL